MDVGTSFGGIGSSREVMIASLAEPAMLMIVFTLALVAGSTQLSTIADFMSSPRRRACASRSGMALVALIMVAIAENARIPVDNPATHLELTMVHEAMVLEYSGRHLAMIELAASLKLLLYVSLIACVFVPWGLAPSGSGPLRLCRRRRRLCRQAGASAAFCSRCSRPRSPRCACFRVPEFLGAALHAGPARHAAAVRLAEPLMMHGLAFDVAHLLAGGLVLVSFMMLYQDRLYALLNVFALHAFVLAAVGRLAGLHPGRAASLRHRGDRARLQGDRHSRWRCTGSIERLGIHREIETVVGIGPTMLAGMGLVALSMVRDAAGDRATPTRWRARISPSRCRSCCSGF